MGMYGPESWKDFLPPDKQSELAKEEQKREEEKRRDGKRGPDLEPVFDFLGLLGRIFRLRP